MHENTSSVSKSACIEIRGAKEHNLKNLSLSIPRNAFVVITGLSGSGKSTLAFDTIFAEGQRRYVESLSNYAKQFVEIPKKPNVEAIDGLSPSIAIQQKSTSTNPRSTVGTVTEIYDFLRLLYARIGVPFCSECGKKISSQTTDQIADQLIRLEHGTKLTLLAPIVREKKGTQVAELQSILKKGFSRVRINGETIDLSSLDLSSIQLDKNKRHNVDVVVDRILIKRANTPLKAAEGPSSELWRRIHDGVENSIRLANGLVQTLIEFSPTNESEKNLPSEMRTFSTTHGCADCGISYPPPEPRTFSFNSPLGACTHCKGIGLFVEDIEMEDSASFSRFSKCAYCLGTRLKPSSLQFKIHGHDIASLSQMSISQISKRFDELVFEPRELVVADRILKEIKARLLFLMEVGVEYLSLDRPTQTLSGGESQRIRLATQIGASLIGVTYVLDEPSIGLHQRDNHRLLAALERLRDLGNTVLVVEHDRDTILKAEHVIDLGPGAGTLGGSIVAQGTVAEICKESLSLTGAYLNQTREIAIPKTRRPINLQRILSIQGISRNNLKGISVTIPLGLFTCVTGVSGSGKSTLVNETLYPLLLRELYGTSIPKLEVSHFSGSEHLDKVIDIDQSPIGRTPRSNPATYTGLWGTIRDLFASLPESKLRGFGSGRFSFNTKGGRCENCQGCGQTKVEMHLLPDVYVTCEICEGARFNEDTLAIRYKNKNIHDVLNLTIDDAYVFFENIPKLRSRLKTLQETGLGYLTLGQSATTLSGGEAQRIKLARELGKRSTGRTFYILDEPSTGLHFDDIRKLVTVLHRLVDEGNTVLVIEHNLDIIKVADHIIDLGPEGGESGGEILALGTPEEVSTSKRSHTAKYLKPLLAC